MLDIKGRSLFPIYDVQDNFNDIVRDIKKFRLLQLSQMLLMSVNIRLRNAYHLTFLTLIRVFPYLNECLELFVSTNWMLLNFHISIYYFHFQRKNTNMQAI